MTRLSPSHFAPISAALCLLFSVLAVACRTTVPDSGRQQLNFMNESKLKAMGLTEFSRLKKEKPISKDASKNALVQRVGKKLSLVMPVPNAEWEFVVFEDESPNAFALPGGKVGVHTGLFQVTENEAGLAAVIGHEVAHVVAGHSGERMSNAAVAGIVAAGAGYALNRDGRDGAIPTAAIGGGALLYTRQNSRTQELEADRLGALYMARAGYDPSESVELWKRFAKWKAENSPNQVPFFLSTHPLDERRIEELQRYLPVALREYNGS